MSEFGRLPGNGLNTIDQSKYIKRSVILRNEYTIIFFNKDSYISKKNAANPSKTDKKLID